MLTMHSRVGRRRRTAIRLAAVLPILVIATACSSSGQSAGGSGQSAGGTGSTTDASTKTNLTGTPIKIGTIGEIQGVGLNWPFQRSVVEAAARGINSRGGINGHPVQSVFCD